MWRILQHPEPDDYVLATGETHTVREFVERAFAELGIEIGWKGTGVEERGFDKKTGRSSSRSIRLFSSDGGSISFSAILARRLKKLGWKHTNRFSTARIGHGRERLIVMKKRGRI